MKEINADTLKQMFISASNNLYNHYHEIDALNVFPVPDGDTGMNMNLTLSSGASEIRGLNTDSVHEVSKKFARGLLMGARGNSGVITSQIFKGFSNALEGVKELDAVALANAFFNGSKTAYSAVLKPVEGTILTIIRESSHTLNQKAEKGMAIEKCFTIIIKAAQESLQRTPELLPILKEVGVVDSGGVGLVTILKGMEAAVKGKPIEKVGAVSEEDNKGRPLSAAAQSMGEDEFGYCTEFIMSLGPDSVKKPFSESKFTHYLDTKGNSIVVVHDDDIVKVHVHTMQPGLILNYAQQYGEFLKIKIENMTEQHHALEEGVSNVEVTPEPADELEEIKDPAVKSEFAMVAVSSGEGIDQIFKELGVSVIVSGGQTMNPSSEDFVSAIKRANAKNVYILTNNSNIVMAASQACEITEDDTSAYVIPSKTILQGIVAALTFNSEAKPNENFREMKAALKTIKSGEVTFSIRDCEINGVSIKKDDFIGIYEKDIVVGAKEKLDCVLSLLDKMIDEESALITVIAGADVDQNELKLFKKLVEEKFPDVDFDIKEGKQPVYSFFIGVE